MRTSAWVTFLYSCMLMGCEKHPALLGDLCVQGAGDFPEACSVLVENVEPNRNLLAGKLLDIRGYLVFRHYFMAVYPTQDHATLGLTRTAVRVRTPHDKPGRDALISYHNQPVRIIGTFINDGRIGMPEWAGSIAIEQIGALPPNYDTDVNPLIEFDPDD